MNSNKKLVYNKVYLWLTIVHLVFLAGWCVPEPACPPIYLSVSDLFMQIIITFTTFFALFTFLLFSICNPIPSFLIFIHTSSLLVFALRAMLEYPWAGKVALSPHVLTSLVCPFVFVVQINILITPFTRIQ